MYWFYAKHLLFPTSPDSSVRESAGFNTALSLTAQSMTCAALDSAKYCTSTLALHVY